MSKFNPSLKMELRDLIETMALFNKLPTLDQIAIKYYIKGRIDALLGNVIITDPRMFEVVKKQPPGDQYQESEPSEGGAQ